MLQKTALILIKVYQRYIRYALPCSCRFSPTCSEYAQQAIAKYGLAKGSQKALMRLIRCHPFSGTSGFDPLE